MALRYANVLKVVLYSVTISPILPIGGPLAIFGLAIIYWVDKWLILRRMVCNNYISNVLSKKMMITLHKATVFFAIGNIFTISLPFYNKYLEIKFEHYLVI